MTLSTIICRARKPNLVRCEHRLELCWVTGHGSPSALRGVSFQGKGFLLPSRASKSHCDYLENSLLGLD